MIRSNKLRNVGILFEALSYGVADHIAKGNTEAASRILYLLRKHFMNEGTEMHRAYKVYSQLLYEESLNYFYATRMLKHLLEQARDINTTTLKKETDALIESIDRVANRKELMSRKIPNFKLYSSFNALAHHFTYMEAKEKLSCESAVFEHMISNKEVERLEEAEGLWSAATKTPEDIQLETMAVTIALRKFKDRYASMNEDQKAFLMKYVSTPDPKIFSKWAEKKALGLKEKLSSALPSVTNESTQEKLTALCERLSGIKGTEPITAIQLTELMMTYELCDSLETL